VEGLIILSSTSGTSKCQCHCHLIIHFRCLS